MRRRRLVFGKDYITETIDCFEGVCQSSLNKNNKQFKFFSDVLSEKKTLTRLENINYNLKSFT